VGPIGRVSWPQGGCGSRTVPKGDSRAGDVALWARWIARMTLWARSVAWTTLWAHGDRLAHPVGCDDRLWRLGLVLSGCGSRSVPKGCWRAETVALWARSMAWTTLWARSMVAVTLWAATTAWPRPVGCDDRLWRLGLVPSGCGSRTVPKGYSRAGTVALWDRSIAWTTLWARSMVAMTLWAATTGCNSSALSLRGRG
jgi:hypothetical protein